MISGGIPFREIAFTGCVILFFLLYLYGERRWLCRRLERIPLRICVTGTRGKSSVTRLIAAILRGSGYRVLAKTTGSKAVVIDPDGGEQEIARRGIPSPLEAKKIIGRACKEKAQVLVAEMMGIRPESLHAESLRLLRPHICVITNVRADHVAEMGNSREEIASGFAAAIPERGVLFVPQDEVFPIFLSVARSRNSRVSAVQKEKNFSSGSKSPEGFSPLEFGDNIRIALAVGRHLGIGGETALDAAARGMPDYGALKIWGMEGNFSRQTLIFVSAFAANDPDSTREVLGKILSLIFLTERRLIGLLNFRRDRGDRTIQWLHALKKERFPEFHRWILLGDHARAVKRRLPNRQNGKWEAWPGLTAGEIMQRLLDTEPAETVIIGMGNMGGAGEGLVDYWEKRGRRYGV